MSEREGLSATALECLALGTPVLLPSYSPIPNIVKIMCAVRDKDDIPDTIARIARSKSKGSFIKSTRGLESFKASSIPSFYKGLFGRLGVT